MRRAKAVSGGSFVAAGRDILTVVSPEQMDRSASVSIFGGRRGGSFGHDLNHHLETHSMPKLYRPLLAFVVSFSITGALSVFGQGSKPSDYVSPTTFIAGESKIAESLKGPEMEYMPIEIADAWVKQNFGVSLHSIESSRFVVESFTGPQPNFAAIVYLTEDFDPSKLSDDVIGSREPEKVGEYEVYPMSDPSIYLHVIDPRTVCFTDKSYLDTLLGNKNGSGPMAELLNQNPLGGDSFRTLMTVAPIRPLIKEGIASEIDKLPKPLQELQRVPDLLEAAILSGKSSGLEGRFILQLLCTDEAAADELDAILKRSVAFGRTMAIEEFTKGIQGEGRMPDAQRAYVRRITNRVAELLQFKKDGKRLMIETEATASTASIGIMVGLLLPAVQAAREAARRMQASNNLKQVGLAIHNYHSAYNKLPGAITDDNGKPLLSWRVAILPFLEQQALYEQFHLDEPWDSEHNIKLVEQMPMTYVDPSLATYLRPGMTVFRLNSGKDLMFEEGKELRFRDCLDGLSNTIMAYEADYKSEAVTWTKPERILLDRDNPLPQTGHVHQGGFHVLMGDGAVIFITHSIDLGLFDALLTRAGGEVIEEQLNQ